MNRKVGDKVKIISLNEISNSPKIGFVESMKKYCGKVATIKRKLKYNGKSYYRIDLDNMLFLWESSMFEKEVKGLLKNE